MSLRFLVVKAACLALVSTSVAAQADGREFVTREQCAPIYSVLKSECYLEKFFSCDLDGQPILRAESFGRDGLYYIDFTDLHGNTIRSWSASGEDDVRGIIEYRDLIEQNKLQANGVDQFDITWLSNHAWFAEPIPEDFSAEIRLTGKVLDVDGVRFEQAILRGGTLTNSFRNEFSRYQYFDFSTGTFPWGGVIEMQGAAAQEDRFVPVKVIYPDDPEFEIEQPQYFCEAIG